MGYRVRPRAWVMLITGTLTVIASVGAYLALKDVAARLEPAPESRASQEVTFDAGLASAFTPGPRLGDLQDVFGGTSGGEFSNDEGAATTRDVAGSASQTSGDSSFPAGVDGNGRAVKTFSGSGGFDSSQGHVSGQGSSDGEYRQPPSYPGGSGGSRPSGGGSRPSNGGELCDMPAFC